MLSILVVFVKILLEDAVAIVVAKETVLTHLAVVAATITTFLIMDLPQTILTTGFYTGTKKLPFKQTLKGFFTNLKNVDIDFVFYLCYNQNVKKTLEFVMININDIVKKEFIDLSKEEREFVHKLFLKYYVRREIAEQNKQLSKIFSMQNNSSQSIATFFNFFNSSFLNCNLISCLSEQEASTYYLTNLPNDEFNWLVNNAASFNRQMALVCFSMRDHERIPNRVDLKTMIAYANMQNLAIKNIESGAYTSIYDAITNAAQTIRHEFKQKYGHSLNDNRAKEACENYKAPGKKVSTIFSKMLLQLQNEIELMPQNEAQKLIETLFTPTHLSMHNLKKAVAVAPIKAEQEIKHAQNIQKNIAIKSNTDGKIEFNDYCDIRDFDEVFSNSFEQQCFKEEMVEALMTNLKPIQNEISNQLSKKK